MKPIKYDDALALVKKGTMSQDEFDKLKRAGVIGPSAIDLRVEEVPADLQKPYRTLLEDAEILHDNLAAQQSGLRVRVQVAKVK